MATAQENFDTAYQRTLSEGRTTLARALKVNWASLRMIGNGLPETPTNEQFLFMADGLINDGQFTLNGATITSAQIEEASGKKIPSKEQLHDTAVAVGSSVADETGSIGFLGGATLMNALIGLIQWMMSGFDGGFDGLKSTIASVTAESVKNNTRTRLEAVAAKYPGSFLDAQTIADTTEAVGQGVLQVAGVATPSAARTNTSTPSPAASSPSTPTERSQQASTTAAATGLEGVEILPVSEAVREIARERIRAQAFEETKYAINIGIQEKLAKNIETTRSLVPRFIADGLNNNKELVLAAAIKSGKAPTDAQRERFATIVADTTSNLIASGNFSDQADLEAKLREEVAKNLHADPLLTKGGSMTFAFTSEKIAEAANRTAKSVGENYSQISSLRQTKQQTTVTASAQAAGQAARSHDVTLADPATPTTQTASLGELGVRITPENAQSNAALLQGFKAQGTGNRIVDKQSQIGVC